MEIRIDTLADTRQAAREFISHIDQSTIFAFYGRKIHCL